MNLNPASPLWLIGAATVVALGLIVLLHRTGGPFVARPVRRWLLFLRTGGLLALLLAALNPLLFLEHPDPNAYRVGILIDASRSMETRDLPGQTSRAEWIQTHALPGKEAPPVWSALIPENTRADLWSFASDSEPLWTSSEWASRPGLTNLSQALNTLSVEAPAGSLPLGAILLFSDGHHLEGEHPASLARRLGSMGIPVTTVGVGREVIQGDIAIAFLEDRITVAHASPGTARVKVDNAFPTPRQGTLRLFREDLLLDEKPLQLLPGESREVGFEISRAMPGISTLRATFVPEVADAHPGNDTAFSILETTPPEQWRVLLISAAAGWQDRLLRSFSRDTDSIQLDTLTRIDEARWFLVRDTPTDQSEGSAGREVLEKIPAEEAFLEPYAAVLIDRASLAYMDSGFISLLRSFVADRGAGCLLIERPLSELATTPVPEPLRPLFPVREVEPLTLTDPQSLAVSPHPLFSDDLGGALMDTPAPVLPGPLAVSSPVTLSRAAQVALRARQTNMPVLVLQAYGAGRSAWMAIDSFWKWGLTPDPGQRDRFESLWTGLIGWLAIGGKDRLEASADGRHFSLDQPIPLDIRLSGRDYTPRLDASTTALITNPDGSTLRQDLLPSLEDPGSYRASFQAPAPGAYRVHYRSTFPDGEELSRTAWFVVRADSRESTETVFNEKLLRDIARLSGGRYLSLEALGEASSLPVSSAIPLRQERFSWTRTWPFLALALAFWFFEWWLRRRHGLR